MLTNIQLYYASLIVFLFITLVLNREDVFVFNLLQWLGDVETTRVHIELMQEDLLQKIIPQLVDTQIPKKKSNSRSVFII